MNYIAKITHLNLETLTENSLKSCSQTELRMFCKIFSTGLKPIFSFFEVHELNIVYYISKQPLNRCFNGAHCSIKFFLLIFKFATLKKF